jgi:putrescine transport system substrate-binding protein
MITAFRFLSFGACLTLAITSCSSGSKPPPSRVSDASAAPGAASGASPDSEKVLNIYNWSDYIDPSVIAAFEKEYGIKVNYDVFDSDEVLATKLLTGHTNYDVVVPGGAISEREIKAGVFQKLDKAQLGNLKNIDPEAALGMAVYDPGNQYTVTYTWLTTTGIGYNISKIKARMPDAPLNSWRMFYDPTVLARFRDCGVSVLDSPVNLLSTVLIFLGKDPNSESPEDLKAVEQVLLSIRPYVRYVDTARYINDLANGETCLALGWSGDIDQARERAKEAGNGVEIAYSIPSEGTLNIFGALAIPADAPHPRNAHLFINYLLRPDVAANNSNAIKYANPVTASVDLLSERDHLS